MVIGTQTAKRLRTEEEQLRRPFVALRQTSSQASCDEAQVAELVDALVSNTNGKPCRFDPGPGY